MCCRIQRSRLMYGGHRDLRCLGGLAACRSMVRCALCCRWRRRRCASALSNRTPIARQTRASDRRCCPQQARTHPGENHSGGGGRRQWQCAAQHWSAEWLRRPPLSGG